MAQDVRVQSGIGLGMKVALGFVLFFVLVTGGTCAACMVCGAGSVVAAGAASGAAQRDQQANARSYGKNLNISTLTVIGKDSFGDVMVTGNVHNKGERAVSTLRLQIDGTDAKGKSCTQTISALGLEEIQPGATKPIKFALEKENESCRKLNASVLGVGFPFAGAR